MANIISFKRGEITNQSINGTDAPVSLFLLRNEKPESGRKRGSSFTGYFHEDKLLAIAEHLRRNRRVTITGTDVGNDAFKPINYKASS